MALSITMSFSPASIPAGGDAEATLVIANPDGSDVKVRAIRSCIPNSPNAWGFAKELFDGPLILVPAGGQVTVSYPFHGYLAPAWGNPVTFTLSAVIYASDGKKYFASADLTVNP